MVLWGRTRYRISSLAIRLQLITGEGTVVGQRAGDAHENARPAFDLTLFVLPPSRCTNRPPIYLIQSNLAKSNPTNIILCGDFCGDMGSHHAHTDAQSMNQSIYQGIF